MGWYRTKVQQPTHDPYLGRLAPGGAVRCDDEELVARKTEAGLLGERLADDAGEGTTDPEPDPEHWPGGRLSTIASRHGLGPARVIELGLDGLQELDGIGEATARALLEAAGD